MMFMGSPSVISANVLGGFLSLALSIILSWMVTLRHYSCSISTLQHFCIRHFGDLTSVSPATTSRKTHSDTPILRINQSSSVQQNLFHFLNFSCRNRNMERGNSTVLKNGTQRI